MVNLSKIKNTPCEGCISYARCRSILIDSINKEWQTKVPYEEFLYGAYLMCSLSINCSCLSHYIVETITNPSINGGITMDGVGIVLNTIFNLDKYKEQYVSKRTTYPTM